MDGRLSRGQFTRLGDASGRELSVRDADLDVE